MSWTQKELVEFCDRKNIPQEAYSFYANKDEAFILDKINGEWLIYYSERGSKNELAWAKNESQAINIMKLFLLEAFKII